MKPLPLLTLLAPSSPQGGTLINYVNAALDDLAAKRPVKTADTKAFGCSVKYAN